MQDYKKYQSDLKAAEDEERNSNGAVEYIMPAGFLIIFCVISAGATYMLNHAGLAASPLYRRLMGAQNAALLVVVVLEGSFLALSLLGHKILKSEQQRKAGKIGLWTLKCILSLNILVAFLHAIRLTPAPMLEAYAQWGAPLTIIGAGFLWSYLVAHRRKTQMRNRLLDASALAQTMWANQDRKDQARYRESYNTIAGSEEMNMLRDQLAIRAAIEQLAIHCGVPFEQAAQMYHAIKNRQKDQQRYGMAQAEWRGPAPEQTLPAAPVVHSLPSRPVQIPAPAVTHSLPFHAPIAPAPVITTTAAAVPPAPIAPAAEMMATNPAELTPDEKEFIELLRSGKVRSH